MGSQDMFGTTEQHSLGMRLCSDSLFYSKMPASHLSLPLPPIQPSVSLSTHLSFDLEFRTQDFSCVLSFTSWKIMFPTWVCVLICTVGIAKDPLGLQLLILSRCHVHASCLTGMELFTSSCSQADQEMRPLTFQTPGASREAPAQGPASTPWTFVSLREVQCHLGLMWMVCQEPEEMMARF